MRQVDVLLLIDTALKGKRKVRMNKYFSFCKNRTKAKGGVATVVSNYLQPQTAKVGEGQVEEPKPVQELEGDNETGGGRLGGGKWPG